MKTHVTFKRDSATFDNESQPFGEDIATALVASFAAEGFGDCRLDSLDYAYTCFAPATSRRCYVMIGLVGDDPQQWLISCDTSRGIFDRLLRKHYDDVTNSVVNAIHQHLTDDSGVSHIRWYTADDWNKDPEN